MGKPAKVQLVRWIGPWTHSRLMDYEQCRLKFKLKHIDKLDQGSSPALERGSDIDAKLEAYMNGWVKALPEGIKLLTELKALAKLKPITQKMWAHARDYSPIQDMWDKTAYCRAKLDAFVETKTKARVIDFKTGKIYPTNDDQVRFYGMLGLKRSTRPVATTELWYVDQDKIKDCEEVHRRQIPALEKDYTRRADRMYQDFSPIPEPGIHCRTCPFRKNNGGPCPF